MTELIASERWERIVGWCFPPAWRRDGRSADMVVTALAQVEADQRDSLEPFEIVDLAVFGLRMRVEQFGRAIPGSARFLMAWAGLLGGVVLGLSVLMVPAHADPAGYRSLPHSWYADVSLAFLLLAVLVLVGQPRAIRLGVCGVLGLCLGAAWLGSPVANPVAQSDVLWGHSSRPGPALFVVLPLAALACFCLDASVLAGTARWLRITLVAGAGVTGLIVGSSTYGYLFRSAPPGLPPVARAVLVALGCGFVIALVAAPRVAPALLLMALPWLLPADVTVQNLHGEHRLLSWPLSALAVIIAIAIATRWRLRSRVTAGTH